MLYLAGNHATVWELRAEGFDMGWLLSPGSERRPVRAAGVMPYAVDNGLYRAPDAPPAPPAARLRVYELLCKIDRLGWPAPFWYVVPDVPYDGEASRAVTAEHAPIMRRLFPALKQAIAVQDGMELADAEGFDVVFVAGSTEWKELTLPMWAEWSRREGKLCHVARVNTARRIRMCQDAGVDSVDGTAIARGHRKSMSAVLRAMSQGVIFTDERKAVVT